ncbi:YdbH domain-containing protein [Inquilinus sp. CAU 1745]|uniref:intermembrane phospholipid transport protein YdbH family protein n=1 Tax=Inquilinus sp. CAU 1745 TaxID=3140369 RepID=UPI00325C2472
MSAAKWIGGAALTVTTILFGLVLVAPMIAEAWISARLRAAGIEPVSLEIEDWGLDSFRLADIRLGGETGLSADSITGRFSLSDLWRERRLDEVEIEGLRLSVRVDGEGVRIAGLPEASGDDGPQGLPDLPVDRLAFTSAILEISTPYGEVEAPADLTVERLVEGGYRIAGAIRPDSAYGALTLSVAATVDPEWNFTADIAVEDGRLDHDGYSAEIASGWATARGAARGAAGGSIEVTGAIEAGRIVTPAIAFDRADLLFGRQDGSGWGSVRAYGGQGDVALDIRLGADDALEIAAEGWAVASSFATGAGTDFHGLLSTTVGALDLSGEGRVDFTARPTETPDSPPLIDIHGTVALDRRTDGFGGRLSGMRIAMGDLDIDLAEAQVDARGDENGWRAELSLDSWIEGEVAAISIGRAEVSGDLEARVEGGEVSLFIPDCLSIITDDVALAGTTLSGEACLASGEGGGRVLGIRIGKDARIVEAALSVRTDEGLRISRPGLLDAEIPEIRLAAVEKDRLRWTIETAGGRVALADAGIEMEEISVDASFVTPFEPESAIAEVTGRILSPWIEPATAQGAFSVEEGAIVGEGRLDAGVLSATYRLQHDLSSGDGNVAADVGEITFSPEGMQPSDLSAMAPEGVREVSGTADGVVRLRWGGGVETSTEIEIAEMAFATDQGTISGLDAILTFDSLAPLTTEGLQRITIDRIDVGLPLGNGVVEAAILESGAIELESARFDLAAGTLSAAPTRIPLNDEPWRLLLTLDSASLPQLLDGVPLENFSVTGSVSGTVPLEIGETVRVDGAFLETDEPGTIRYNPAAAPETPPALASPDGVQLLLLALADFHYESLTARISGPIDGDMTLELSIDGANPALYDGYPIALNLNLSGALNEILQQSLETANFGEQLEELYRNRFDGVRTDDSQAD